MVRIDLSYEEALAQYPEKVAEAIQSLRASNSKYKDHPAEDCRWFFGYSHCVPAVSYSREDLITGNVPESGPRHPDTISVYDAESLDAYLGHYVARGLGSVPEEGVDLGLCAQPTSRSLWGSAPFDLEEEEPPPQVVEYLREAAQNIWTRNRTDRLSHE
jgi:hypothetical protein